MRIITERDLIRGVAAAWSKQYSRDEKLSDGSHTRKVLVRLKALNQETATAEDVAAIIGNSSWTGIRCDECGESVRTVIQIGEEQDYESATANICPSCFYKAAELMRSAGA
jgi:hypothetical protein